MSEKVWKTPFLQKWHWVIFILVVGAFTGITAALGDGPPEIPHSGLAAELQKNWAQAALIYRRHLREEPDNVTLWVRLRDVERAAGNPQGVLTAMEGAVQARPEDAVLHYQLMQIYSEQKAPQKALQQATTAVALAPDNIAYLLAHATLANWLKEPALAKQSYSRVLRLDPQNPEALLSLARTYKWDGDTDEAVTHYQQYCAQAPEDKEAFYEYIIAQGERGNYSGAMALTKQYKDRFNEDHSYRIARATILAWADRPFAAFKVTEPMLAGAPDNFEANYAHTLALHYANRPRDALAGVEALARIRPEDMLTENTRTFVDIPLRSNIWGAFDWYWDSDTITHYRTRLQGELRLQPETKLLAGLNHNDLKADRGSGLEALTDDGRYTHRKFYVGGRHRFRPALAADVSLGYAETEDRQMFAYTLGADLRLSDSWRGRLERWYDFSLRSPRTASLGIKEALNTLNVSYKPDLTWAIDGFIRYGDLSDDNTYWDLQLAPRVTVLRSQRLNLDIGPVGYLLHYDKDLSNGYYDPHTYQKYLLRIYGYWKFDDDHGISFTAGWGGQKDDLMDHFKSAQDISMQGFFGIYKDLLIRLRASATHNLRESAEAYNAFLLGLNIDYRF